MTTSPETVRPNDSARGAAARMREANAGFLPVVDQMEEVVGVLTDRDLALRLVGQGLAAETPVEQVMSIDVVACSPDDDLDRAEALMRANQKSRLPVIDESGRLAGVISISDIAQYEDSRRTGDVVADITEREV